MWGWSEGRGKGSEGYGKEVRGVVSRRGVW